MPKIVAMDIEELVQRATRKPYLTCEELMELQHLRDTEQIPSVRHVRNVIYPTEGIYAFFEKYQIYPRKRGG